MTSTVDTPALRWAPALVCLALMASCASYNKRTGEALAAFQGGRFSDAASRFADTDTTGSQFLAGAEAGMSALVGGEFERAIEQFDRAAYSAREVEEKALLDPASLGETLVGWAINESAKTYQGEGFERVMLHSCLGLAYLATGDVEAMLVETRRANQLLSAEEDLYEVEYRAGGLGHFLSAIGYELRGEIDQAYIDYKALEAKGLGGDLVGTALVRSAKVLQRADELPRWQSRFGDAEPIPQGAARVVLVAGVGMGPFKQESRLDIPTGKGLLSWSVPAMIRRNQQITALELSAFGTTVRTDVLEEVSTISEKNLGDRLNWLARALRGARRVEARAHRRAAPRAWRLGAARGRPLHVDHRARRPARLDDPARFLAGSSALSRAGRGAALPASRRRRGTVPRPL